MVTQKRGGDNTIPPLCALYDKRRSYCKRIEMKSSLMRICILILIYSIVCLSQSPLRPTRRRRNNTGFYYGIRDDDILRFADHDRPSDNYSMRGKYFGPLVGEVHPPPDGMDGTIFTSHLAQNQVPDQFISPTKRGNLMGSLPQNLIQSLIPKLLRQPHLHHQFGFNRSKLLNRLTMMSPERNSNVIEATVKSKSRTQISRKKRRKNNTGFYYGIREDILILPHSSSSKRGEKRSKLPDNKNSREKQRTSHAADDRSDGERDSDMFFHDSLKRNDQFQSITTQVPTDTPRDEYPKEEKHKTNKFEQPLLSHKNDEPHPKKKKTILGRKPLSANIASGQYKPGIFDETLHELREMKDEIIALREELRSLKGKLQEDGSSILDQTKIDSEKSKWWIRPPTESLPDVPDRSAQSVDDTNPSVALEQAEAEVGSTQKLSPWLRRREFEKIGRNVETWACTLLFDQENKEEGGWKEIECNKFCRKKFNPDGRTQVYLKWMPDSRDDNDYERTSRPGGEQDFPCIKCYSTIDAPMDKVCSFLSNENTIPVYNELVEDYCDVEEITPHSKITWCKMPKVMFVKSRDFVTYCSHRWWSDGTQVIVNQACEHEDKPGVLVEGEGEACRGYALRGANFISKDPDDPNKTRITLLAHANPGGGLPHWAMTTAVNAVVQVEPFKLFHSINEGVSSYIEPVAPSSMSPSHQLATVNTLPGRSSKPAGMAQMGYVCFWPNGGGLKEKHSDQADNENVDIELE